MSDTMSLSNSEWKEVKLENVVSKLGDGLHGTPKYDDNGEYYFVNGNNLGDGKITIKDSTKKTSIDEYKKYKKDLNDRTILVSINGTLGNIGIYNNEKCFLGKSACYFNVKENVEKLFIKYVVTNNHFQEHISVFANGTTIKNVSLKTMREYPFLLPPLPEQKSIAEVLSSLDDKIDLLHRQNKTLEQIAETLFRQWFVEEAKEDWEYVTLDDYVTCYNGVSYKSSELNPSETAMVTLKSFARGGGFRLDGFKEFTGKYKETHIVKQGDIAVAHTDITQDAALVGNPVLIVDREEYKILVISMDLVKVEPIQPWMSKAFLYYLMKTRSFKQHCLGHANGSTVLHLSKNAIPSFEFFLPPVNKIKLFTDRAANLLGKKNMNISQIRTLEKMRDTLLPKLISGEVRIV